jgi:hypothetical protein
MQDWALPFIRFLIFIHFHQVYKCNYLIYKFIIVYKPYFKNRTLVKKYPDYLDFYTLLEAENYRKVII